MDDIVSSKPRNVSAKTAPPSRAEAEAAVRTLIAWAGDDPEREGLRDTPRRVVAAYEELFAGYGEDPAPTLARVFEEVHGYKDIILVRDIPFFSHCEHHIAPFFGKAHIAYYPRHGVVGLSKLARIVDTFARRLQTQEALTAQVVEAVETALRPLGVAILIEAEHTCISMRGVKKDGISTTTLRFTGKFKDSDAEQQRFLSLLRGSALMSGHAKAELEESLTLAPNFGPDGLITCVTIDAEKGDVLMVAHMNAEALERTLASGIVHYWSRSRQSLWRKGDTSGQTQSLIELRVDCDQDCVLARVKVGGDGGACHTGRRSCFYRRVVGKADGGFELAWA